MNASPSTTILVWGALVSFSGFGWLIAPDYYRRSLLLSGLFVPSDFEPYGEWTKMFACLAIVLGGYYMAAGLENDEAFARRTVFGRTILLALMILARVPKGMLTFAVSDALGAIWTWYALQNRKPRPDGTQD